MFLNQGISLQGQEAHDIKGHIHSHPAQGCQAHNKACCDSAQGRAAPVFFFLRLLFP